MIKTYSDRSKVVTHQQCPRRRFYTYDFPTSGVGGVVPNKLNIDTTLGSTFHNGVYHLLNKASLEEAVGRALEGDGEWEGYWPSLRAKELQLEASEDIGYVYHEQAALAEALIRGYYYYSLPKLLETYEVVESERDDHAIFVDEQTDFSLKWGYRTDALLLDKLSRDLYILSLKTKKVWNGVRDEKKNHRDMQGLTEIAGVEYRLRRWQKLLSEIPREKLEQFSGVSGISVDQESIPEWFISRYLNGAEPIVHGVKMEFALKGYRSEYPKGSGQYKYSNPLIRPYKRAEDGLLVKRRGSAGNQVSGEYALQWEFKDELGGNHTLGKGWRVLNIWEDMGVKNWIEYCMENEIQGFQPGYAIEKQFVLPQEYYRNSEDVAHKLSQILKQEGWAAIGREAALRELAGGNTEKFFSVLDEFFPQYTDFPHDCNYCPFEVVCYGPDAYKINPLSNPNFVPRTPNHLAEGPDGIGRL